LIGEQENSLRALLADFSGRHECFHLGLQIFSAFPPRVIYVDVLPAPELAIIQKELEAVLVAHHYRIKQSNRVFHPHVTIANRDLKKEDFAAAFSHFSTLPYYAEFTASGISLLTHRGASWETTFFAGFRAKTNT
jgi:2'-5' RNA ligase